MGLSVSLDIATRALRAQQLGVDVTSHNIANVNTPGFSRQELRLRAEVVPVSGLLGRNNALADPGRGVDASDIRRMRDSFLDFQMRDVLEQAGRFRAEADSLRQAEVIFNEPSENGLASLFGRYWNAWRDLTNAPETAAARANLMAESQMLSGAIRQTHTQLQTLQRDLDTRLVDVVADINTLAAQVAGLNTQIVQLQANRANAGDLIDQRDLALDTLSGLIDATVAPNSDGSVTVLVGGRELVSTAGANQLAAVPDASLGGFKVIRWATDNQVADFSSGKLAGLINTRDVTLASQITDLNTLVAQFITSVNGVHSTGFGLDNTTGENYFTGTNASDIGINAVLAADTNKIAASSAMNAPGDSSIAQSIADLETTLTMSAGTSTFGDFYNSLVGRLGVRIREADGLAKNQEFLRDHLDTLRESVAGVNLDEEMTNLIKFQHAFEAAAQLISVVDSMLDTLVNRVGTVGR